MRGEAGGDDSSDKGAMIALHKQRKRRFSEGRIAEVSVYGQICGHAKIAKIAKAL
jgi:hypothetical protein